jgi:histidinol-phosphate phosphatase family protein
VSEKAIFLDKDGTLIENVPYNVDPAKIDLVPGAGPALARLYAAGYALIVISNQPGIARGLFAPRALDAVFERLRTLLAPYAAPLAGFYYCPHDVTGRVARYVTACGCRKPAPGLLLAAATIHGVQLERSWMIGDILDDVEAGQRAGCRTVLIDNGNETEWRNGPFRIPDVTAPDLREAADAVLRQALSVERWSRREVRA